MNSIQINKSMGRPKGSKNKPKTTATSTATSTATASSTPSTPIAETEGRVVWSDSMIEYLLELRLENYRNAFSRNISTAQMKVIWAELTLKFNLRFSTSMDATALQSKFQKLKGEYNEAMHDDNRTGNDGTALKDSIPYWDILLCKFQGKDGIGVCFGDSEESSEATDDFLMWAAYLDEDENDDASGGKSPVEEIPSEATHSDEDAREEKRKKEVQEEIENQRKRRKEQKAPSGKQAAASEISSGLVYLGDSLREGLRSTSTATDNETKDLLNQMVKTDNETKDLLNQMVKGQAELTSCFKSFLETFRFPPPPPPPCV
jgi:hypothetical protein